MKPSQAVRRDPLRLPRRVDLYIVLGEPSAYLSPWWHVAGVMVLIASVSVAAWLLMH